MFGRAPTAPAGTAFELEAVYAAIKRSQAVIEFTPDGEILTANELFLNVMGYRLEEIVGKHHSLFADPAYTRSPAYKQFWETLRRGEFQAAEYKRIGKGGKEVWIQASYNPIFDPRGQVVKVIKFATDVTEQKLRNADYQGQIEAIGKSQAVIEFNMDGTIRTANENFLGAMGYSLAEIQGKHHRMFVDPAYAKSGEYAAFWETLRRGEYQAAEYKRIGKGGREVWIQASYNPILDLNGAPVKVVKYATDITDQVHRREQRSAAMKAIDADLSTISAELSGVNGLIDGAASAATQTSANVQAVASAVEEMTASIQEISAQVSRSNKVAGEAVSQSRESNQAISQLSQSAQRIGDVVKLITDIAAQTNLLALNATIEAARAGEAGKGFAVVASEVKNLAGQTAKATDEISAQIQSVQEATQHSVQAIEAVTRTIEGISEIVNSIAAAVEEQSTVTGDISANMQTASDGVDEIARNSADIAEAVRKVEGSAKQLKDASAKIA